MVESQNLVVLYSYGVVSIEIELACSLLIEPLVTGLKRRIRGMSGAVRHGERRDRRRRCDGAIIGGEMGAASGALWEEKIIKNDPER